MSIFFAKLIELFLKILYYIELLFKGAWFLLKIILWAPVKAIQLIITVLKWIFDALVGDKKKKQNKGE